LYNFFINEWIAASPNESLRLQAMIDAIVALRLGLNRSDFAYIMLGCDLPIHLYLDKSMGLDPKGFWRNGKNLPLPNRPTIAALFAFDSLLTLRDNLDNESGVIEKFVGKLPSDGWQIPRKITKTELKEISQNQLGNFEYTVDDLTFQTEQNIETRHSNTFPQSWSEVEEMAKKLDQILSMKPTKGYFS